MSDTEETDGGILNPRQEAFCIAYCNVQGETYGRAEKSALAAGYPPSSARTHAWRMLKNRAIRARLRELYSALADDVPKHVNDLEHVRLRALETGDLGTAARCSEIALRRLGCLYERLFIQGDDERQREFSDAQRDWARRVTAAVVLHATLPAPAGQQEAGDAPALPQANSTGEN